MRGRRATRARRAVALAVAFLLPSTAAGSIGALSPVWERLLATLPKTVDLLAMIHRASPRPLPGSRLAVPCAERIRAGARACLAGRRLPPIGCTVALRHTAERLAVLGAEPSPRAAPFATAAEAISQAVLLLRVARRGCDADDDPDVVPAQVALVAGGAALRVEPTRPLAPGARWRLAPPEPVRVVATSPRPGGAPVPPASWLPPNPPAHVARFAAGVLGANDRGWTVRPQMLLCPEEPVRLAALRHLPVFRRLRDDDAAADAFVTVAPPLAADAGTARSAGHVTTLEEVPPAAAFMPRPAPRHVASVARGRFAAVDTDDGSGAEVGFLLALPRRPRRGRPVVILLHGLDDSAQAIFSEQADLLAARGLAIAAFDLPDHGGRTQGRPFLDPLDPAALARKLRRAASDTIALAAALATLDAAERDEPGEPPPVRLLGYSLGGMVGALALAADPTLGTAVLVAPAGDLQFWLGLAIAKALGPTPPVPLDHPCPGDASDPANLRPSAFATAYRTALAPADPQTVAAAVVGADGRRAVLVQEGTRDEIVTNANTEWLAAAIGADPRCRRRRHAPQTLCRFPGLGHTLVRHPAARRQAHRFLATDGRTLGRDRAALAAR